ncbi:Eco57I restriction-modification methylase domain-containing protein [Cryptosporangium sp. NPDC048952]|uniref:Eco57I restriction-modification methylase domain-containing protein n=1 Tax=Cryptosporangium sp. NPDC048952 TaxID=3363961 RepID=UPI003715EF34
MAPVHTRRPTASELHRGWLTLVDADGPFLAVPPLKRVWPHGMPALGADRLDALRAAKQAFDHAWEDVDLDPDNEAVRAKYTNARDEWVQAVLGDVVGWRELLVWGPENIRGVSIRSPNRQVTVAPTAALSGPDGLAALVSVVERSEDLRAAGTDGWAANAIDRMAEMLRRAGVEIGVVTDGRWWALVCARPKATVTSGIVDALTWVEEPLARDAFLTLLGRQYLIGGATDERLPWLFNESVAAAEEVTEALGAQVRRAVQWLIQAFAETAAESRRRGLADPLPADPDETYAAAVTVMMRVVFLLFAEERGLLPQSLLFRAGYGVSDELDALERRVLDEGEESLDSTFLTWHRLLATSQALYQGASFEDMRMPAYGGSLFDPDRFGFLTATNDNGTLALPVSDRVLLHLLRAVQIAQLGAAGARRISFREIDVEQIGYIYENLLGYTCVTVCRDVLVGLVGLVGASRAAPEVPLSVLEALAAAYPGPAALAAAIVGWLKENRPGARPLRVHALAKLLASNPTEDAERELRAISADDEKLRSRLRRWAAITRRDLRGRPTIVLDGGLLVTETPSRRNAGAHYTPSDLAMEVVAHALKPLCYSPGPYQTPDENAWKPLGPGELLRLKVVDIAAGSGAFLVAAARYLGDRLVEAWIEEDPANAHQRDLRQHAIREVVARCIYGADINAMAVEMCKLSLWLVSLDPHLPFSFVDDKILHGNSLLGLVSLRQLRSLHIDPPEHVQPRLATLDMDRELRRVIALRTELAGEVKEHDPQRSTNAKRRQLALQRALTAQLTEIADGVVAAGLKLGGKPGRALDDAYADLADAVGKALPPDGDDQDSEALRQIIDEGLTPIVQTDYRRWKPLHWVLEVPDVMIGHGGFDAVIGNPPFLGGQKLTGAMGMDVRDWFVNQVAGGARGSADLAAYFLLRAARLLRPAGTLGLLATNTLAQGDSRAVGLDQLVAQGMTLTRAVQSSPWPSASANLEYAAVWGVQGPVAEAAHRTADGIVVPRISTLLEPAGQVEGAPARLVENANIAFIGCYVLGMGFVLEPEEAQEWITEDARDCEVLFPYLNGEDLNSRPDCSPSRWVIDFNDRCEICARRHPVPFDRVRSAVLPERRNNNRKIYRDNWWLFAERRPALRRAITPMHEVLVIALVSKSVMPMRVPTGQVFSHMLGVFATDSYADQAVLSSSLHQLWAITYGSTLETRVRYTPSDVFETFPRPTATPRLIEAGKKLDIERREIMLRRQLGVTKLYNLVNDPGLPDGDDPDVARMRRLHIELDQTVLAAYGWSDVVLDHGFHTYRQMIRWTFSPAARVEILDRLLAESLRRAAAQPKQGKRVANARKGLVNETQGTLL